MQAYGSAIYASSGDVNSLILTDCIITENTGEVAVYAKALTMTGGEVTKNISDNTTCPGIDFSLGTLDGVEVSDNSYTDDLAVPGSALNGGGIQVSGFTQNGSIIKRFKKESIYKKIRN